MTSGGLLSLARGRGTRHAQRLGRCPAAKRPRRPWIKARDDSEDGARGGEERRQRLELCVPESGSASADSNEGRTRGGLCLLEAGVLWRTWPCVVAMVAGSRKMEEVEVLAGSKR